MNRTRVQRSPKVSLARVLSKLGFTSRKQAATLIEEGRVCVNGVVRHDSDYRCDISTDRITVDDCQIRRKEIVYIAMNKPVGVVTTRTDERNRKTVYDLLGDVGQWVFPIGRLDKDTSGLLMFTNDTRLGERLTNPASKVPKTYRVNLETPIMEADIKMIERGMLLDDEQLLPARIEVITPFSIELTIVEGKNRQIRRMFAALDYTVHSLERIQIGALSLEGITHGSWRYLNKKEVEALTG
jgi:23S rRNA pseudouridine2605 synthase